MLPPAHRITKQKDFDRMFRAAPPTRVSGLLLRKAKSELSYPRFGFIVSKRAAKKAVDRNRIKRLLRQTVHHNLKEVKGGWDIVITALPGFVPESLGKTESQVRALLKRASLLNH